MDRFFSTDRTVHLYSYVGDTLGRYNGTKVTNGTRVDGATNKKNQIFGSSLY